MSAITRKAIDAFRASITPGDLLIIEQRGWWRGDGGDPDMYQRVVEVRPSAIITEAANFKNNEGFRFQNPKRVTDVLELTDDSIVYTTGRYTWGFRIERES